MKSPVSAVTITKYQGVTSSRMEDLVASEEPLEIRLKFFDGMDYREKRLAVTMRTPGHDFELAVGFLLTEGIIASYSDIDIIFYCEDVKEEEQGNVVIVRLVKTITLDESVFNRNFYVNSSCGVCGKSSLESIRTMCSTTLRSGEPSVSVDHIHHIQELVRKDQSVFKHTGGLHASALINRKGEIELIREDIGRHNALDKLIGARAAAGKDNTESILFVSGRAGFELVQKAVVAGIPIMIAVGAPSSLAVELASSYDQTLIGFARGGKFNVYSGLSRVGV
jgi:FdhD protein